MTIYPIYILSHRKDQSKSNTAGGGKRMNLNSRQDKTDALNPGIGKTTPS